MVKGLSPRPLDPLRYHVNPDLTNLEKGIPWRTVQDEFGKYRCIDHEGRTYQGTPYAVEEDPTAKPNITKPDVTFPEDIVDNSGSQEVVHHEEVPGQPSQERS